MDIVIRVDDAASSIFDKDNSLNLDDSEESFVILDKDVVESLRSSSPDEGVSECDYSDQQSIFSSVSHSNAENELLGVLEEKKNRRQERFEKLATYQKEVLSTLREMTEKLDLMKSTVNEASNDIDSSADTSNDLPNKVDTNTQSETAQDFSLESDVSLKSVETTQTSLTETHQCISAETEAVTVDGVEIQMPEAIETQCIETKRAEAQASNTLTSSSVEELASSVSSVEQYIMFTRECDKIIEEIASKESCILIDSSLTENDLAECRKRLKDYRYRLGVEKNSALIDRQACLSYAKLEELTIEPQILEQEEEKLAKEKLEKEVSLLTENCNELTKTLEDINAECDALRMEKNKLSEERDVLNESSKLLKDELKSREEKYEVLKKENNLLKTRSDAIQGDLDNLKDELADARLMISELQEQNADLQEIENAVDVYESRNEKQEIDILRLCATEKSHLCQIESLTDEINILRDYINRLLTRYENA